MIASDRDLRLRHLRFTLLGRVLDDKLIGLYSSGLVPGNVFPGKGQEA